MRQKLAKQIRKDLRANRVDITTEAGKRVYRHAKRLANAKAKA